MISLIAAVGKNNELGLDNHLIFNIPGYLKFFRNTTLGKTVIMGRKTYESIGKPLPKRINIVVSNSLKETDGITIINSFEEVLEKYLNSEEEVFIIGGESLYNYFINFIFFSVYFTLYLKNIPRCIIISNCAKKAYQNHTVEEQTHDLTNAPPGSPARQPDAYISLLPHSALHRQKPGACRRRRACGCHLGDSPSGRRIYRIF